MVEHVLKDDGFVMFGVFGAVEQGGRAFGYRLFQERQLGGVVF